MTPGFIGLGWDSVPPTILKIAAKSLAPSLTSLYNNCILTEQWPEQWKKGEWTPVFKKEDKQDCKNHRPVTVVSKIFELLLSRQFTNHYEQYLYNKMTAYTKTLIKLVEDWKYAVDNKELVSILTTNMSKAFEALSPALTIKKLEAYGLGNKSLGLMCSFFSQRSNRVKLSGVTSSWKEMRRGCPQGSGFGPMLWNIFQNDMPIHVKKSNLMMYADDHPLYTKGKDTGTVHDCQKIGAEQALAWYAQNFLMANPEKFQSINHFIYDDKPKRINRQP